MIGKDSKSASYIFSPGSKRSSSNVRLYREALQVIQVKILHAKEDDIQRMGRNDVFHLTPRSLLKVTPFRYGFIASRPRFPQEIAEEPSLAGPPWDREAYDRQPVGWCVAVLLIRRYPTKFRGFQSPRLFNTSSLSNQSVHSLSQLISRIIVENGVVFQSHQRGGQGGI